MAVRPSAQVRLDANSAQSTTPIKCVTACYQECPLVLWLLSTHSLGTAYGVSVDGNSYAAFNNYLSPMTPLGAGKKFLAGGYVHTSVATPSTQLCTGQYPTSHLQGLSRSDRQAYGRLPMKTWEKKPNIPSLRESGLRSQSQTRTSATCTRSQNCLSCSSI